MSASPAVGVAVLMRRAQWRVAAFALLGITLLMLSVGLYALREYEARAMELVARSLAFAGEPALRFNDRPAMRELIEQFAMPARIAEVDVVGRDGGVWLHYERPAAGPIDALARSVERLLVHATAGAEMHDGALRIGRVALRSDGQSLLRFMLLTLFALLLAASLTALAVAAYASRFAASLARPINALASLTRQVRNSRSFERRAKHSSVLEIDALADDFNALLDELQRQRATIQAHHDDLRRANESLKRASRHDPLTQLPNRGYLGERLAEVLALARRQGAQAGLLFIDTDRFKEINDELGHAAGDALLVELSKRLRAAIRDSDFVARLGGDEFVIVISPLGAAAEIGHLTGRIRSALDLPLALPDGLERCVSVTMGVAIFPDHADGVDALIRAADAAMYRAKATGRGSVVTFDPGADPDPRWTTSATGRPP